MRVRFGPLQEIPLDHERLSMPEDGHSLDMPSVPSKRPPSPTTQSLCSPLKKRLLLDESSPTRNGGSTRTPAQDARVSGLLRGPHSPARKLDFGVLSSNKQTIGNENLLVDANDLSRVKHGGSRSPTPTPALLPSLYDPSAISAPPRMPSTNLVKDSVYGDSAVDVEMVDQGQSWPRVTATLDRVCREVCEPDRSSSDYPGFDVFQDPHDYVYKTIGTAPSTTWPYRSEQESDKENVRPVRPLKTHVGATAWAKAGLLSPKGILLSSPGDRPIDEWADECASTVITPRAQRRIRDIANIAGEQKCSNAARAPIAFPSSPIALLDCLGEADEPVKGRDIGKEESERAIAGVNSVVED